MHRIIFLVVMLYSPVEIHLRDFIGLYGFTSQQTVPLMANAATMNTRLIVMKLRNGTTNIRERGIFYFVMENFEHQANISIICERSFLEI
jgi:hypothetical protein